MTNSKMKKVTIVEDEGYSYYAVTKDVNYGLPAELTAAQLRFVKTTEKQVAKAQEILEAAYNRGRRKLLTRQLSKDAANER